MFTYHRRFVNLTFLAALLALFCGQAAGDFQRPQQQLRRAEEVAELIPDIWEEVSLQMRCYLKCMHTDHCTLIHLIA